MSHPILSFLSIIFGISALVPNHLVGQELDTLTYKIFSTAEGREVEFSDLIRAAGDANVLFFGEEHDHVLAHQLQAVIYRELIAQYGAVTLSLEMFETDCQQVVDEYLAGIITQDKLIADARPWTRYVTDYHPIVEIARENNRPVIAANAPRRYVNLVSRKGIEALGTLPKSARRYLAPLPIDTRDSSYYDRFMEAMGEVGHGGMDNFYYAQCTWDATMAHRIYQHWKQNKKPLVFHLVGKFHIDYKGGTVRQLKLLNRKLKILNISCMPRADFAQPDWGSLKDRADFVIVGPESVSE